MIYIAPTSAENLAGNYLPGYSRIIE